MEIKKITIFGVGSQTFDTLQEAEDYALALDVTEEIEREYGSRANVHEIVNWITEHYKLERKEQP